MSLRAQLRKLKSLAGPFDRFDTDKAPEDPGSLFENWLQDAISRGIEEAHAMTLSTVDEAGRPDARILILKDVDADGWHFATTELSPKGQQIAVHPYVALTFYWQPQGRQIRLRGQVIQMTREVCEGTTFHFVTDGIEAALRRARGAAGDKDIKIGGGVATARQYISVGYVDEIHLAVAPVVLGQGEALFQGIDLRALGYRTTEHVPTERATHIVLAR